MLRLHHTLLSNLRLGSIQKKFGRRGCAFDIRSEILLLIRLKTTASWSLPRTASEIPEEGETRECSGSRFVLDRTADTWLGSPIWTLGPATRSGSQRVGVSVDRRFHDVQRLSFPIVM